MARIPKFDEENARRFFELYPGTKQEKAAAVARFYGFDGGVNLNSEEGAYRSHGDIISFIGNIVKDKERSTLVSLIVTSYEGIEFEAKSPRNGNQKQLFTYDQSLERFKAAGYERHARPSEVFSFLIAGLENKLTPAQKLIAYDMLSSYGEWLSMALVCKKDKILLYQDPENLKWDGHKHIIDGNKLICSNETEFPLAKDSPASTWIDLNKFDAGLVQFLYSRQFAQLPEEMREGGKKAQLYLPPKNTLWPLGRGVFSICDVGGCNYYGIRASRGVRKKIP